VQKWPDGQKGGYNNPDFFFKKFFYQKFKKKNYGQYEKFCIQLVKLQKFGTLRG
jgi:hypothetical protein